MFEKLIGNKKKKQADIFTISEKKYTTDHKLIAKMTAKPLIDLYHDQEKYISSLVQKIEQAKEQYERVNEKNDQLIQKNEVVNSQIARMTNEHEQLTIKFDNLQTSLEMFSSQNEAQFKKEIDFMKENEINTDRIKNTTSVMALYREKVSLCRKIQQQNKSLKSRYAELEEKFQQAQNKLKEYQQDKNYNHMIPSLLDEIKDLKEKNQQKPKEHNLFDDHFMRMEQQIMRKVKSQVETTSILHSQQQAKKAISLELQKVRKELQFFKQKNATLQTNLYIMSDQNRNAVQTLTQFKNKLEKQLNQSKKSLDLQKKNFNELQNKFRKTNQQLQSIKFAVQKLNQEKAIKQNAYNSIKSLPEESQKLKQEIAGLRYSLEVSKKEVQSYVAKIKMTEQQIRNFSNETQKLVKTIQSKDNELKKVYANIEQQQKQKNSLLQQINDRDEQSKIRTRKYQSQLNQERIKLQSLNRKLGILETQVAQNKTSMDSMYEQLLAKDKKMSHMQIKLKEYKHMIQVLRKEKQDMENNYESKLSSMQPEEVPPNLTVIKEQNKLSPQRERLSDEQIDHLKNQLYSLKQQNIAILAQNQKLRSQLASTDEIIRQKDKNIKILQQKRDQMLKEIQKIGRNSNAGEQLSGLSSFGSPKQHYITKTDVFAIEGRDKKIASKALKGFEIMLKLQHSLYKNFMLNFSQRMQQQNIKRLQKQINLLIKKSADMKDVFQGYLD